jgi:hypothetical protein
LTSSIRTPSSPPSPRSQLSHLLPSRPNSYSLSAAFPAPAPSLPLLGLRLRLTSLLPPSLPPFLPNQPTCAAANTPRARWPSHFIQLRQPEFQHRLSRRAMLYRVRGSTFRTLLVRNEFPPLVVTFSTCHIFAALRFSIYLLPCRVSFNRPHS